MSTPYRDATPAGDSEPIPDLSVRMNLWPQVFIYVAYVALYALASARENIDKATALVIISVPGLVVLVLLAALYEPGKKWLAARRARAVVEGVAELEAKVSAGE
jgi:hypothetical protein